MVKYSLDTKLKYGKSERNAERLRERDRNNGTDREKELEYVERTTEEEERKIE